MTNKASGFGGAVREQIKAAGPLLDDDEATMQRSLFGDDPNEGSPVGGSRFSRASGGGVVKRRTAGRPEGARNLSTQAMVDFLSANYRHPLLGMADIVATSPEDLAELLLPRDDDGKVRVIEVIRQTVTKRDGTVIETEREVLPTVTPDMLKWAYEFWQKCAFELSEYMATKQPRNLALPEELPPGMTIVFSGDTRGAVPGQRPPARIGMSESEANSAAYIDAECEVPQQEVPQDEE